MFGAYLQKCTFTNLPTTTLHILYNLANRRSSLCTDIFFTYRISLVFGYGPANSFQPTKTILKTMQRVDLVHKLANFEYFREKAWQGRHCLDYYVNNLRYTYV